MQERRRAARPSLRILLAVKLLLAPCPLDGKTALQQYSKRAGRLVWHEVVFPGVAPDAHLLSANVAGFARLSRCD